MKYLIQKHEPLWWFILISPFICGGFYEWVSCLYSIVLIGYLLNFYRKKRELSVYINLTLLMVLVLVLFYGISIIWAVDHGMAALGFFKFLPLLLFVFAVMQIDKIKRDELFNTLPLSGMVMVIISFLLGQIPALREIFFVNGRLAGFFQYPNTFALFLLAGIIILGKKECWDKRRILYLFLLLAGIVLTGSRTVFLLLITVVAIFLIRFKGKTSRLILCSFMSGIIVITLLYVALTGNMSTIARYLTVSFHSSTFLGRLLYFKDALPVILKHPLGLGYMGYYYMQGSFQTGVYTVLNVHNELLQVFLDVGWFPAIVFIGAVVRSFFAAKGDFTKRLLLIIVTAHCMFDFDLQFISIGFILILAMDLESGNVRKLKSSVYVRSICYVLAAFCLWLGAAAGLYRWGKYEMAVKIYPGCTDAWISMLTQTDNAEDMENIADKVISKNKSVSMAYSAKAKAAYAKGDFENMIFFKQQAISLSKYRLDEYLDYFDMLYVGIQLYTANGDMNSAEYCRQRMLEIPDMLQKVLDETDDLGWKINDQPELVLPEVYLEILDNQMYEKNIAK